MIASEGTLKLASQHHQEVFLMDDVQIVERLYKTRKLIENGWTQGVYSRSVTHRKWLIFPEYKIHYCVVGAAMENQIAWVLYKNTPKGFNFVIHWNDDLSRRKEEVLAYLDQLIAQYENKKPEESFSA